MSEWLSGALLDGCQVKQWQSGSYSCCNMLGYLLTDTRDLKFMIFFMYYCEIKSVGRYDGHWNFFLTNNTYYNEPRGHYV